MTTDETLTLRDLNRYLQGVAMMNSAYTGDADYTLELQELDRSRDLWESVQAACDEYPDEDSWPEYLKEGQLIQLPGKWHDVLGRYLTKWMLAEFSPKFGVNAYLCSKERYVVDVFLRELSQFLLSDGVSIYKLVPLGSEEQFQATTFSTCIEYLVIEGARNRLLVHFEVMD